MSQKLQVNCDQCGEIKKESNGWFKIQCHDNISFTIVHWGTGIAGDQDICSQQCATRALQEFMSPAKAASGLTFSELEDRNSLHPQNAHYQRLDQEPTDQEHRQTTVFPQLTVWENKK